MCSFYIQTKMYEHDILPIFPSISSFDFFVTTKPLGSLDINSDNSSTLIQRKKDSLTHGVSTSYTQWLHSLLAQFNCYKLPDIKH